MQRPTKKQAGVGGAIGIILAAVFAAEGGYVNDPRDPGGATNHGITEAVARQNGYTGDMRKLTAQQAADIYVKQYIDKPGFRAVVDMDPYLGEEMVDAAINVGPPREARWFQESLNHYNDNGKIYPDIAEDGKIGPGTMAAFYALRQRRGPVLTCKLMIRSVDAKQAQHYMRLASTAPTSFEPFITGWMRTRVGNVPTEKCDKL